MEVLRRNAIGLLALFVALGGTAFAVSKIGPGDIANNAVRSKHITKGQVRKDDTELVKHARAQAAITLTSADPTDQGPEISVQAKTGDLLDVHVRADIRRVAGPVQTCDVKLGLRRPGGLENDRFVLRYSGSDTVTTGTIYMKGDDDDAGTSSPVRAEGRQIPIVEPGRYTVFFRYDMAPGLTCIYSERNLWVQLVR